MDETDIKVKGEWLYYYRAVDKFGDVVDYYFSTNRDETAAKAFLNKALPQNDLPEKVVINGSKNNYAASDALNVQLWLTDYFMLSLVEVLDIKYLNNILSRATVGLNKKRGKLWDGRQLKEQQHVFMVEKCGRCSNVIRQVSL